MGTLYSGVAGNVSLASTVQTTVPADGDNDNAAVVEVRRLDDHWEPVGDPEYVRVKALRIAS